MFRPRALIVALAALVLGCSATRPPHGNQRSARTHASVQRAPRETSDALYAADAATDAGAPDARTASDRGTGIGLSADPAGHADAGSSDTSLERLPSWARPPRVNVPDWLAQHGISQRFPERDCWETLAGVPPSPSLICTSRAGNHRRVARVYRNAGGRLQAVWEGTVATWMNWVDLLPRISSDGDTLEFEDARPGRCQSALREAHAKLEARVHSREFVARIERACAQLGRYRWAGYKYVRDPVQPVKKPDFDLDLDADPSVDQ